jgi:hypothetical protein
MSTAVSQVPSETLQKWQEIVNTIAGIMRVPSALIMKVEPPYIKVFVSSESNGNPYERGELAPLNTGLYCETVMKTRQALLVPDCLRDDNWKSNPDIELGMISYLGFPIAWPDGQIFGTICVLDKKKNSYGELHRKFLLQCRDMLQADLTALARLARSEAYLEEAQRLSHTGSFGWKVSTGEIDTFSEQGNMTGANECTPSDPYSLQGPLLTWSGDMAIAVVFSKEQAGEAEAKFAPDLILSVNLPKAALFRTADECGRFFEEA